MLDYIRWITLVALLSGNLVSVTAQTLSDEKRINLLIENGAYELGLELVDKLQSSEPKDIDNWLAWETRRYRLYQKRQEWNLLSQRLLSLPIEIPDFKRHELMTQAAELMLASGRGESVRQLLRTLIWRSGGDSVQLNYWRRLVIRSYLADDATHDASVAMGLYEREYLPADKYWDYLYAQVLLRLGDTGSAAKRLSGAQEPAAKVLRMLSRLRSEVDTPEVILKDAATFRETLPEESPLIAAAWAVSAEAARLVRDWPAQIHALEQLFNGSGLPPEFGLFELSVNNLWEAYGNFGKEIGNEHNLLFGDPEPWMNLAKELKGEGSALRARAINAAVAIHAVTKVQREELHSAFYDRLRMAELLDLSVRLYQSQEQFPTVQDIPDSVRHRIVAYAVDKRDMKLAAKIAQRLQASDTGQTQTQWDLIRARLAMYAGDFDESEVILTSLVLSNKDIDATTADQIMQPIFDLQSAGRTKVAYELLNQLYQRVNEAGYKREMLMWMGDAKKADEKPQEAAELYLSSAFFGGDPSDLWGQAARYSAAEALTEAGLLADAERIYESLLRQTQEKKRVVALQKRLQELWVKRQGPDSSD